MEEDQQYQCAGAMGAEVLLLISSLVITICVASLFVSELHSRIANKNTSDKTTSVLISSAYAIFLPLMSYLFSQEKQYIDHVDLNSLVPDKPARIYFLHYSEQKAQIILTWMVFIEIIRTRGDPISASTLRKSAEQLVRLIWVGFLVCIYTIWLDLRGLLLVPCVYFFIYEVLKRIIFNVAMESYLIGKSPNAIHNYMKRVMQQDDLHTTPMSGCDYIVLGEENHEKSLRDNGYVPRGDKSNLERLITIGRVFQNSPEDEEIASKSKSPYWRDTCVSLALAKMLRRRFARLPLDEAGCTKALDFVLEGLIGYIGSNKDAITGQRNQNHTNRVFKILREEMKIVYEFLHIKVPIYHYYSWYVLFDLVGAAIVAYVIGVYLVLLAIKGSLTWTKPELLSENLQKYHHCLFLGNFSVVTIFTKLDIAITCLLYVACIYIQLAGFISAIRKRWFLFYYVKVKRGVKHPARCANCIDCILNKLVFPLAHVVEIILNVLRGRVKKVEHCSVFDTKTETILFRLKVIALFPKWVRRKIPRVIPDVCQSSNHVQEAILNSLRSSHGRLTNGETLLRRHGMGDDVIWACQPNSNRSTTEDILVWHIATTLLHHQESQSLPQKNSDEREVALEKEREVALEKKREVVLETEREVVLETEREVALEKEREVVLETEREVALETEREVALELSSYCHHLVAYLPELLPVEVDRTKDMYERVIKEILAMDQKNRCNDALQTTWDEGSIVGRGARLAKALMNYTENGKPIYWTLLADFWVWMMLYIAPSDNVEAHAEILEREELITQLWALLTHAGILTWPKPTEHGDHVRENNEITGDRNV